MYNVVLDTNILHAEGIHSRGMATLKKLIDEGIVKVHLPELVVREFSTKKITVINEAYNKAINILRGTEREARGSEESILRDIDELKNIIDDKVKVLDEKINGAVRQWIQDFRINIIPLHSEFTSTVFENYFCGNGVFKSKKSREDIPDAFISLSIEKLHDEVGELMVVLKDALFRKHLSGLDGVKVYDSLDELFQLPNIRASLENEAASSFLTSSLFRTALENFLQQKPNYFEGFYLEITEGTELLADWVIGAHTEINDYGQVKDITISDVIRKSESNYSAKISFKLDSNISYVTDYGEVLKIERDKNRSADCWSMTGDGMCDLNENVNLTLEGDLSITFQGDFNTLEKEESETYLNENVIVMTISLYEAIIDKVL
ncbi:PIN domain-containing protein [Escherichia coli]